MGTKHCPQYINTLGEKTQNKTIGTTWHAGRCYDPAPERLRQCCLEFKVSPNLGYKVRWSLEKEKTNRQVSKAYK